MRAHRLVAGAFGDGIEFVGEEAIRLVRKQAGALARPFHQGRHQLEILDAADFNAASTCLPMAP